MYIKIRKLNGKPGDDDLSINISKKAKIQELRSMIFDELAIETEKQRLFYKGKQLIDDHDLYEYGVQLNDVIQLMVHTEAAKLVTEDKNESTNAGTSKQEIDSESQYYQVGDKVDVHDVNGAWFEAKIIKIFKNNKPDDSEGPSVPEADLIYRCAMEPETCMIQIDATFSHVRPRSFYTFKTSELHPGLTVLVNYNMDEVKERGYWYDFKVAYVYTRSLKGTLYFGRERTPLENVNVKFVDEVLRIEKVTLLSERGEGAPDVPLRKVPFNCKRCKDDPKKKCKDCGCKVCHGKDDIRNMLLCDECDDGYHIGCLSPPLEKVPEEDEWYCPNCKTDENEIVKAGDKLKFSNKKAKMPSAKDESGRDWGRGMACVGRTKECTIVSKDHLGPVPGVDVGTCWKFRFQVSEMGIHRPLVAGIHGRESSFAYSLVLSGGYEDDIDNGDEFYYTGSGGRDLSGNKRVSEQSCDQTLTRMNKALAMNCNAKFNPKEGAEATDWRGGRPVRVVRNYKGAKHSKFAPKEGNRYDGVYKVVKYYPEKGKSGFTVWRYLLRRDDPNPAPWEDSGHEHEIIYPPGYLEAQEKKRGSKRALGDSSNVPAPKKSKANDIYVLPADVKIETDSANSKQWAECLEVVTDGKAKFLAKVEEMFTCICCQEIVYLPITTECKHNICKGCLKRSFSSEIYTCPYCRFDLGKDFKFTQNQALSDILQKLFPGYETSR